MRVGAVDIGTNSVRLLITDGMKELEREVVVTGLGQGVDATGRLSEGAMDRTVEALSRYGELMTAHDVEKRRAIATSACRDAANRDEFFDPAESALGVRPDLISGEEEASLAFSGAVMGLGSAKSLLVSDIGGGSTEFVNSDGLISVDIGSIRLTDRQLPNRPPSGEKLEAARASVRELFTEIGSMPAAELVGVAGTWTSLAAIALDLDEYDRARVHESRISAEAVGDLVSRLARLTVDETAAIPSLDPRRAPVILAGAVIADAVLGVFGFDEVVVSENDTLDAVALGLLDLP